MADVFPTIHDPASAANFSEAVTTHLDFVWRVEFELKKICGSAELTVVRKPSATRLVLDVHQLTVESVLVNGAAVDFSVNEFAFFGDALEVPLPAFAGGEAEMETLQVVVQYHSGEGAAGLCWLEPAQTAGKTMPYLFTQGQAVLNRSVFPCQDSPCVRVTFSARVFVEQGFTAVMSATMLSPDGGEPAALGDLPASSAADAEHDDDAVVAAEGAWVSFRFDMQQCIPCYLIAMAVGDLRSRSIGPRSKVWCEPCQLEAAWSEFETITEQFVATGEALFGPYLWETYDIVVMPPAFPYGGMENPRLTFVTCCLLCGDKSLADVVAHEIAHSWFGNLTTNATWSDFFLNEGFTMYAQRRITTEVYGLQFTMLEATTGRALLHECVEDFGADSPMTRLRTPLEEGIDPDDTYSEIAYEKGYALIMYLESVVGQEALGRWLRAYVQHFQFRSITAEDMFAHFLEFFPEQAEAGLATKPGFAFVEDWLMGTGMGPFTPDYSAGAELTVPAESAAAPWLEGGADGVCGAEQGVAAWPLYQQLHFLDTLQQVGSSLKGGAQALDQLADAFGFDESTNAEVRLRWCQLVVKYRAETFYHNVRSFLALQGKQKYTLPIYKAMVKHPETVELALEIFALTANALHVSVRGYVRRVLHDHLPASSS